MNNGGLRGVRNILCKSMAGWTGFPGTQPETQRKNYYRASQQGKANWIAI